jgi:hypothetical protein
MKCSTCNKRFSNKNEVFMNKFTKEKYVIKSETCSFHCEQQLEKKIGLKKVVIKCLPLKDKLV